MIVTAPGEGYRFDGLTKTPATDPEAFYHGSRRPEDDELRPEAGPRLLGSPLRNPSEARIPAAEAKPAPLPPANQTRRLASGPRLGFSLRSPLPLPPWCFCFAAGGCGSYWATA